jgi:predicted nucleic acid-binding protein
MKNVSIYLDTSVFSSFYDDRNGERMQYTREFWNLVNSFDVWISELVISEIQDIKDPLKRSLVLELAKPFQIISINDKIEDLADLYVKEKMFNRNQRSDALHLASSSFHGIDILVSWNFKHLVKRKTRVMVNYINYVNYYPAIDIIAPPEL